MNVRGVSLALHPSPDYLSDHVRAAGDFFEADILDEVARRVTPGGVLVDVGAMLGNHAAYLAAFVPHTAVHAFEPSPLNLVLLRQNVAAWPTVHVHAVALSDRRGQVTLWADASNHGHTIVPRDERLEGVFTAPTIPLDAYDLDDVRLLKVDVEGHEARVLAGARGTIARCRPLILVEDWEQRLDLGLLGYRLEQSWPDHQTYLWSPEK